MASVAGAQRSRSWKGVATNSDTMMMIRKIIEFGICVHLEICVEIVVVPGLVSVVFQVVLHDFALERAARLDQTLSASKWHFR
eukprot:7541473-Pyramimonas_sp.AAC.1